MAVALPGSFLGLTQEQAVAAPLPADYGAAAHADIVDLDVDLLTLDLAGVQVGHSRSTVASTAADGTSSASSANLDGNLIGTGLALDEQVVTAPPSADPAAEELLAVDLAPVIDVGTVAGDTQAAFSDDPATCVPANAAGERALSEARTTLAGLTLASLPGLGRLADVRASDTRTRTFLDDDGTSGSDVVSRATTTVGDISLLGGAVSVDVTNPVVLEARSDGTSGTASYSNPPSVSVTAGGTTIDLLPGDSREIDLGALGALADLTVSVRPAQDQSAGATGAASTDAFLSISLDVLDVGILDAASIDLDIAPMSVEATAPEGGVECPALDEEAPAAPVIVSPADGDVVGDATPEFSGTAEPGSTVVVEDSEGNEVCTDVADGPDGAWSCSPAQPLPDGEETYTATATDEAGNTSPEDTVTFEVDTTTTVTVEAPADGSTTDDTTPTVSGTGEPGGTIVVTEGGTEVCATTVGAGGNWSCSPAAPLSAGEHTLTVTVEDEAGNTDTAQTTFTIAPDGGDTTAPDAPVILTPADGEPTNDATPEFSGTAEPGSTVVVEDSEGNEVCTADAAPLTGAWSCTPDHALPDGEDTYTATATDAAGNTSPEDTVTFEVDTTTTVTVETPADGSTTDDTTPTVTGTGEPGGTIEVTENGLPVCSTTVQPGGSWTCTPSLPLLPGAHTFTVTAEDEAGNTDTATVTVTVEPSGDPAPLEAPDITSPAPGATVQDTTPTISGTGEPGATVGVREGSVLLCTAVVGDGGQWSCSSGVVLQPGPHTVSATQRVGDRTSEADTVTFTVAAAAGDADGDDLTDQQESTIGTNPNDPDTDDDGLADGLEVNVHTTDPLSADTDDDGLADGPEVNVDGTDPSDADTDDDRVTDGREVAGVRIRQRFEACGRKVRTAILVRTNPLAEDTDTDGLSDGREIRGVKIKQKVRTKKKKSFMIGKTRTNPTKKDTDRDGLDDEVEITGTANKRYGNAKTDPTKCDTDRGGVRDGAEVRARANPADWRSGPRDPRVRDGRTAAGSFGTG